MSFCDLPPPRPLSALLNDLKAHFAGKADISIDELLEAFHERGFGFFLFLISLPAAWPFPGLGLHQVAGVPLVLLMGQMMIGRHTLWLPRRIRASRFEWRHMDKLIDISLPWVHRAERISRPRLAFMTQRPAYNLVGLLGILMSICITVPFPFSNTLPALCLAAIAIGLLMRDGLAVLIGTVLGGLWSMLIIFLMAFFGMEGIDMIRNQITSLFG